MCSQKQSYGLAKNLKNNKELKCFKIKTTYEKSVILLKVISILFTLFVASFGSYLIVFISL